MTRKRDMKHPGFLLGVAGYILIFIGVVMQANDLFLGTPLIISGLVMGAIHWLISLFSVATDRNLGNPQSHYFWLATVIMIPPLGGMIYYMIDGRTFTR